MVGRIPTRGRPDLAVVAISKFAKKPCAICGLSNHPTSDCRQKPEGECCWRCGLPGHRADKCKATQTVFEKKTGKSGSLTARKSGNSANSAQTGGDVELCAVCDRAGHTADQCRTKECPYCGGKHRHDHRNCKPGAQAHSIRVDDEGEFPYKNAVLTQKMEKPKRVAKFTRLGNTEEAECVNSFGVLSLMDTSSPPSPVHTLPIVQTTYMPDTGASEPLPLFDYGQQTEEEFMSLTEIQANQRAAMQEAQAADGPESYPLVSLDDDESDLENSDLEDFSDSDI